MVGTGLHTITSSRRCTGEVVRYDSDFGVHFCNDPMLLYMQDKLKTKYFTL